MPPPRGRRAGRRRVRSATWRPHWRTLLTRSRRAPRGTATCWCAPSSAVYRPVITDETAISSLRDHCLHRLRDMFHAAERVLARDPERDQLQCRVRSRDADLYCDA